MTNDRVRPAGNPQSSWRSDPLAISVALLLLLAAAAVLRPHVFPGDAAILNAAAVDFAHQRYAEAERGALEYLKQHPKSAHAWLIAGESAARLQANERALAHFSHVVDDGSAHAARALYGRARRLTREGRLAEAEQLLRRVLQISPDHGGANNDLVYLLGVEGRSWEALPFVEQLIRSGRLSGDHLHLALSTEMVWLAENNFVDLCIAARPEDPLPLLGRAREALRDNNREVAKELLQKIVRRYPEISEAQARLGRLLLEADSDAEFLQWHAHLPPTLDAHPDLWVNRGLWASKHAQPKAAVRCFWEAVRLQPNHGLAHYQLALALGALNDKTAAEPFAARARQLSKLDYLLADAEEDLEVRREIALALEELGRPWEAAGWYWATLLTRTRPEWAGVELRRLAPRLLYEPSLTTSTARLGSHTDFSRYPLPDLSQSTPSLAQAAAVPQGRVRFTNVAAQAGLNFQYFNGADPQAGRAYMFEFNGGGAAVLDYDNDGWPDIYLTQGCRWPVRADDNAYRDRLFRNLGTGQFVDVTDAAGLGDNGLSSGVTVGDIDNDGWPDLYVGNIGPNRMYHNNGDGTFSDVTEMSTTAGNQWTSGAAIADLNQDGLPDLYVVNYLAGPEVFERACDDEGRPVQCGPTLFPAEQDRLYLNRGDGTFEDATETSGIVVPDGKGLGIVVADFDGNGKLGIFIANDTTANFLFRNQASQPGQLPQFTEEALISGVAFDEEGHAQACMGVAAGEVDDDGLVDLFITNFYRQANALYVQTGGGLFANRNRPTGIYESSFLMLGWGTQFLDAELDGRSDLMLVNGHVNDFRPGGTPYHMRPQFLRKVSRDRFTEVAAEGLGPYFSELHLGRALARLDWNLDGREDLIATHIDAPVALLENDTQPHGHYLSLRLIGVSGARDAIGTRVKVVAGGRTFHGQLTAGDGFQASNERRLVFGLGAADRIDAIHVRWPDAAEDVSYAQLPSDRRITLIEGTSEVFYISDGESARN